MSDLPPVKNQVSLLIKEIEEMRRGGKKGDQKPHKLLMLLAVLDLFDQDPLHENRIYFNQQLVSNFEKHFRIYAKEDDWCQPGPPFFHLRTSCFWKHKVKEGRESIYNKLTTSGGGTKRITENIEFAYFDDNTFTTLREERNRNELRTVIINLLKGD